MQELIVRKHVYLRDFTKPLEAADAWVRYGRGRYRLRKIPSPIGSNWPWLVVKGTTHGGSQRWLRMQVFCNQKDCKTLSLVRRAA